MRVNLRETTGLILMLIGLGLISVTVKAMIVQPVSVVRILEPIIEEFQPVQPSLRCPIRVMILTTLDNKTWIFAVPTSCTTA